MVTFQMTLLVNKQTNLVMGDGWVCPFAKTLPSLLSKRLLSFIEIDVDGWRRKESIWGDNSIEGVLDLFFLILYQTSGLLSYTYQVSNHLNVTNYSSTYTPILTHVCHSKHTGNLKEWPWCYTTPSVIMEFTLWLKIWGPPKLRSQIFHPYCSSLVI